MIEYSRNMHIFHIRYDCHVGKVSIKLNNEQLFHMNISVKFFITAMLVIGMTFPAISFAEPPGYPLSAVPFKEKTTFLSRPPEGTLAYPESAVFSPDMTRVAFVAAHEDKKQMQVVVNNKPGKPYTHIAKGYPIISRQNHQVGYIADKNGKHYVVVNEKAYPGYEGACGLTFSPDGRHMAYISAQGGKQFVVKDGQKQQAYDAVDRKIGVRFSANSTHWAYVARQEDGSVVRVLDGKESRAYDAISRPVFSPDGNHLACLVTRQKKYYTLRDNEEIGPYDMVDSPVWSPDSEHLAFLAIKTDKWIVVKDDQELPAGNFDIITQRITVKAPWFFEGVPDRHRMQHKLPQTMPPKFSPDSSRLAWAINTQNKYRISVDGETGPLFDQISEPVFSPNSRRFAYIGKITNEYIKKEVMMVDGQPGPSYDFVGEPVFSPDSGHLAYRAMKNGKWFIVRDGKEQPSYDAVLKPVYSPNSRHIAYAAAREQGATNVNYIITDQYESDPYRKIFAFCFSPNSDILIYLARIPLQGCFAVANNQKGGLKFSHPISDVFIENPLQFISPYHARTIVSFIKNEAVEGHQLDIHFSKNE